MPSLELRRIRIALIWCDKIVFSFVDMTLCDEFFLLLSTTVTFGHAPKI